MEEQKNITINEKHDFLTLFGYIDDELIYTAGQPWKKTGFMTNSWKKVVCAALVCMIALSCIFHTEAKAAFDKIISMIGQIFNIQEDVSSYTDVINTSISKEGITVTLEETIMGKNELNISYLMNSHNPVYPDPVLFSDVWINNQKVVTSESYSMDDFESSEAARTVICCRFDDTFIIDDPINVKIIFHNTNPETMEVIDDFEFNFIAQKSELTADTIELSLDESLPVSDNESIKLTGFTLNAIESTIKGFCNNLPDKSYFLKGRDDLGNPVLYRLNSYSKPDVNFVQAKKESHLSTDAKYVELQLYAEDSIEQAGDITDYDYDDSDDPPADNTTIENDMVDEENKSTGDNKMYPIGESFTICIKGQ